MLQTFKPSEPSESSHSSPNHLALPTIAKMSVSDRQTLGHERDGTEELRMPEFVCIANRHEHNAEVILAKFHAMFLPEPSEGPLVVDEGR